MKTLSLCAVLCLLSVLPVPAATNNDRNIAEDFSAYIQLHRTRGEEISLAATSRMNCTEGVSLRGGPR